MPVSTAPAPAAFDRAIAIWLFSLAAMVAIMVIIGGLTRLTGSGLSMVEWRPLLGWLPPLSEAQWTRVFSLYQESPEFRIVNSWMDIDDFRRIFWWEYIHRLWGRLIGLAFVLPFLWFLLRHRLGRGLIRRLVAVFLLGAIQGGAGWWMVQSGLVDDPAVSQYRLTLHLSLAMLILGLLIWFGLDLVRAGETATASSGLRRCAILALAAISLTIVAGALVAGLDAGMVHNTVPLMSGHVIPPDYDSPMPAWLNALENPVAAQLHHRLLAVVTVLIVLGLWWHARHAGLPAGSRWPVDLLAAVVLGQAALGIATLLAAVPVGLAAAHQAGAMLSLAAAVRLLHGWRNARPAD